MDDRPSGHADLRMAGLALLCTGCLIAGARLGHPTPPPVTLPAIPTPALVVPPPVHVEYVAVPAPTPAAPPLITDSTVICIGYCPLGR